VNEGATGSTGSLLAEPTRLSQLGATGRRLADGAVLSDRDCEMVSACLAHAADMPAGHELMAMDAPLDAPKFLVSGWACLSRSLPDGRRQIIDLFLPGDLVAYSSMAGARAKGAYTCLTGAHVADARAFVSYVASGAASDGLVSSLRRVEEDGHARIVDQLIRAGRMLSHERMAHLILDISRRHQRAGLLTGSSFAMPLTQEMIGDVLGMSTVHVNRTLQLLRREQILKTVGSRWQLLDFERLEAYAGGHQGRENQCDTAW
jgi:CRP-like cAMP-binding protein